jgi:hypothetical protein
MSRLVLNHKQYINSLFTIAVAVRNVVDSYLPPLQSAHKTNARLDKFWMFALHLCFWIWGNLNRAGVGLWRSAADKISSTWDRGFQMLIPYFFQGRIS